MSKENNKKTFKIVTLGCRTNQYESQGYRDQLEGLGLHEASGEADVCIVNTCTVTESADSSSRHAIQRLRQENPHATLVVTGCYAEQNRKNIEKTPGPLRVVPNSEKNLLVKELFPEEDLPELSIRHFDAHTRAFVKVQDGCNSFCTYCIIPYVRGRSRSRKIEEVRGEVEELIRNGFKEIVITGINVGDFDGGEPDGKNRLADLIRTIDAAPGLKRLRLSSIDPDEVDEELADAILNGKTTCPSMHIVLQSGSNVILKRMNRKYTRQQFMKTIDTLRNASPDFEFTTDVIVGFPGETESDFHQTLEVIEEVGFAKVHMFPYSDRPRTRSSLMPDKIPGPLLRERKSEVLRCAEQAAFRLREKYVGRTMEVLTENGGESSVYITGHTTNFLPVFLPKGALTPNELIQVRLVKNTPEGLLGEYVQDR